MANGFVNIVYGFYSNYIIKIFCFPVIIVCIFYIRNYLFNIFVSSYLNFIFIEFFTYLRKKLFSYIFMNKKCFTCVAYSRSLYFSVNCNINSFFNIGTFINKYMTVSNPCLYNRNSTVFHYRINKSSPSPWYKQINILIKFHHFFCAFSCRIFHKLNYIIIYFIIKSVSK